MLQQRLDLAHADSNGFRRPGLAIIDALNNDRLINLRLTDTQLSVLRRDFINAVEVGVQCQPRESS